MEAKLQSPPTLSTAKVSDSPLSKEILEILIFISRLQVSHPLYKHLLKHNVTRMSKILSRAQPYVQLEEVMKTSVNYSAKRDNDGGKSKSLHEASAHAQDQNRGQRDKRTRSSRQVCPSLQADRIIHFAQAPHQWSLQYNQGSTMGQAPETHQYDPSYPRAEEYCSYHDSKGHKTMYCWSLRGYPEELICQDFLKEYVLIPEVVSGSKHLSTPPLTQP